VKSLSSLVRNTQLWGSPKNELAYHGKFATRDQARNEIAEYIEIFYDPQRTQTRPDYPSPAAFAQQFNLSKTAA
jgi:putative transposase